MSFKTELYAVNKLYAKLIKLLPVEEMLPALTMAGVITDGQKEKMNVMKLDKERASFLLDKVIIVNLKCGSRDAFDNFLQVLEEEGNPIIKKLYEDLNSYLTSPPSSGRYPGGPPPLQKLNSYPFEGPFPFAQAQPPYDQSLQTQVPYGQLPQAQPLAPYGQFRQAQPPYGQPLQTQPPYGQPLQTQPPYGQPLQTQPPYGQLPQAQMPPLQAQIPYGQSPQVQPSYGQQFQAQVSSEQPPQRQISLLQRQATFPPPDQSQYGYSPQNEMSPQIQSPYDQFPYGQHPYNPAYSQPFSGQMQGGPQQSYYSQSQSQQPLFQPQPPFFTDTSSQQNHQMSSNSSYNPLPQVNPTSDLSPQHKNVYQHNCSQQAVAIENQLSASQQQNSSNYPPQDETAQNPNNLPEEDVIDFHENPEEIPKVLHNSVDYPSQEETIDDQLSVNDQAQKEVPKALQTPGNYPSQEETIDVQLPENDNAQKEIPKVLQSPAYLPSQEEIINLQTSTSDQAQEEIPKVLQSPGNHPSQEKTIDIQILESDQAQKEIPKVLQSPAYHPSQEEIISLKTSTNDQAQKEIPKVLQSPAYHPSQEEIIGVHQAFTDDQQIPKVSKYSVSNNSPGESNDVQPSPCRNNKVTPSEGNSAVNVPQQNFNASKAVAGHKEWRKTHQQIAKENLQVMEWINCMKSVCRIESKCKGTGVIGYFAVQGCLQYVLLTCHHVIPTEDDAKSACLYFGYTNGSTSFTACPASSILDTSGQWFWTDPTYRDRAKKKYGLNYSMMKVRKSELDKIKLPGMSQLLNIRGVELSIESDPIKVEDCLTLMAQTPHLNVTYGNCTGSPSTAIIKYDISTVHGSAGSPIFKQEARKPPYMVAVHNGYAETKNHGVNIYMNYGVRLIEILNHCNEKPSLPMPPSGFTFKQE